MLAAIIMIALATVFAGGDVPLGRFRDAMLRRLGRAWNARSRPRRVPALAEDGEPLDDDEAYALSEIEMDSMITIPEPVYRRRRAS
jgi:hypothetical protein